MAPPDRLARYGARLLVDWLSERFETQFELSDAQGDAFVASDGEHRIGVYIAPLWDQEAATAWEERLRSMEERLSAGDAGGPFLLWCRREPACPWMSRTPQTSSSACGRQRPRWRPAAGQR